MNPISLVVTKGLPSGRSLLQLRIVRLGSEGLILPQSSWSAAFGHNQPVRCPFAYGSGMKSVQHIFMDSAKTILSQFGARYGLHASNRDSLIAQVAGIKVQK